MRSNVFVSCNVNVFVSNDDIISSQDVTSLATHLPAYTRVWAKQLETETDETDDDRRLGGYGFYSHKQKALTHSHWVEQVISAGSFGGHDTQASEASHKTNMGLASRRVRHGRGNVTQKNMQEYLRFHTLCLELKSLHNTRQVRAKPRRSTPRIKQGVTQLLYELHMGGDLTTVPVQQHFLHSELRIARVELLDMLCDKLGMTRTNTSYSQLQCLNWTFGQKLTRSNGVTYWATDSKYLSQPGSRRRDMFLIRGMEQVRGLNTAFCCEAVAFVEIDGFKTLCENRRRPLPTHLREHLVDDNTLRFVIGRWLTSHSTSLHRDSLHRPVCPGPLQLNHCLWTYAKTSRARKTMVTDTGNPSAAFNICRDMFGNDQSSCARRWEEEQRAYYALISTKTIISTVNIIREYVPFSDTLERSDVWLETVTVV